MEIISQTALKGSESKIKIRIRRKIMKGIWGLGLSEEMNITLGFVLDIGERKKGTLRLAASSCYKLYADGRLLAFGPQRAAHGYARVAEIPFSGRVLVVEVENCGVETFCWVKQPPFFACEANCSDGSAYTSSDFSCFRLSDRVQRVQRYSYQRGFAEVYRMSKDRSSLYRGAPRFERAECTEVPLPTLLGSSVGNAKLSRHAPVSVVGSGRVDIDVSAPLWRDRAHTEVGRTLGGYKIEEWSESATDEASKFVYRAGERAEKGALAYTSYDFGRAITGFTELEVRAEKAGSVYVVFDELLWAEAGKGENYIAFDRNTCSNVHKWTFEQGGTFRVSVFEPYTVRYACVVYAEGTDVKIYQRDYENPNADRFRFRSSDEQINSVMEAARATLAQNAVDLLTDCPSRERAGWLSDSWFSSVAEKMFTGDNAAERTFLENYILAERKGLPEGMIPMCYPADNYDGIFIPNWAMWYILEVAKYAREYGSDGLAERSKANVMGIFSYFASKENELGLLENLESWVFVEWSAANDSSHIAGVNIPSNICYAACLAQAGALYGDNAMLEKAESIRAKIKELAFDGKFFSDNLVRDESGKLVRSGLLTEVCQYYAFWFDCASREEYPELFEELMERLGTNRAEGYRPEVGKPNVMYGVYMRIDLLMRMGERRKVLDECLRVFGKMAERTGTLWEHNSISASCDHGFASYAARWLVWSLTGCDVLRDPACAETGIGVDCDVTLPSVRGKRVRIKVEDNRVRVYRALAHVKANRSTEMI